MAEALQSKTQGKKELVERNSVDLALGVGGCTKGVQRSIEKWLQHSDEPLSLSFQFPCYSFLELSLMLQFTFLCLFFILFLFEPTCSHLEDWRTSWLLALFPPLSWMSMQLPEIADVLSFLFSKSFSIFQQDSLPHSKVSICVKKKKAHRSCGLFSKGTGAGIGNATRSAKIACRAQS